MSDHVILNTNAISGPTTERARNLWIDPAMQTASSTTAQGATVTVEAGGKRIVRTGNPGRASTNAAQRVAVTPLAPIAVTARRTVPVAVQGSGAADGRFEVVGYDSTGSHRSNAFQVRIGGAPTVGSEVLAQTITPPDWVVSLEVNFYTGGANGDAVVWSEVGVITPPGPCFDGNTPDADDISYTWAGTPNESVSIMTEQTWMTPRRTRPLAVAGYQADRESRNVIHDTLAGGVGVSHLPPRPRSGDLVTAYLDRAAAFEAMDMYAQGRVFQYTSTAVPELDMSFVLNGRLTIEQDTDDTDVWYVAVGYQEVTP